MRDLFRAMRDYREFWRIWLPMLLLTLVAPPLVLAVPIVEKQLIDGVVLARRLDLLPQVASLYGGLWLLVLLIGIAATTLRAYLVEQLTLRVRQRLLAHAEALSLAFSQREHSGRTMALFVNDAPTLVALLGGTVFNGIGSAVLLAISLVTLFLLNQQLALVVGIVPPIVAGLAWLCTRPLRPAARRVQEKAAELNEHLQENLAGIRETVAFGQGPTQGLRFTAIMTGLVRLRMRLTLMDSAFQVGQSAFSLAVTLAVLGYGGYLVITGQTTLGTLLATRTIFSYVFQHLGMLFGLVSNTQKVLASADRLFQFLDEEPRVQERAGARSPADVAGAITFEQVDFAYHPGTPVLHQVSFTAHPGEVIALVGPSGAGKTTIASLIARFYDPTAGRMLLDGIDLRELTLTGLRSRIAIVFQDTFLFAQTIRENIAFGREGATEAEIVAAARAAYAWEFIERLPDGLDTQVGERGAQLSQGQRQRLAIARALLRDPRILILDEPTAALDARSEQLIQAALENLMRGRTTFVIAHRLATIRRADQILVLDNGRVVEAGTHAELLARDGLYRELTLLQFGDRAASGDGGATALVAGA